MWCVLCLRNNASLDLLCAYCNDSIGNLKLFKLDDQLRSSFSKLDSKTQNRIIKAISVRLKASIAYGLEKEFNLSLHLGEYIDMAITGEGQLDIPTDKDTTSLVKQRYSQYTSPRDYKD